MDAMAVASGASVPMGDGVRSLAAQISEFVIVSELRSNEYDDRSNSVLTQLQELVAVQQQMLGQQLDIQKYQPDHGKPPAADGVAYLPAVRVAVARLQYSLRLQAVAVTATQESHDSAKAVES